MLNLATSSSIELILNCSRLRSFNSSSVSWFFADSSYSRTTVFGKKPAHPSMAPAAPTETTGSNCCPRPVKVRKWSWSTSGLNAICASAETSPWESLQPTMFGCFASVTKVEGVILTLLDTPG